MHNDRVTISTHQLFALFPDAATARSYLESRRWPNGIRLYNSPFFNLGETK